MGELVAGDAVDDASASSASDVGSSSLTALGPRAISGVRKCLPFRRQHVNMSTQSNLTPYISILSPILFDEMPLCCSVCRGLDNTPSKGPLTESRVIPEADGRAPLRHPILLHFVRTLLVLLPRMSSCEKQKYTNFLYCVYGRVYGNRHLFLQGEGIDQHGCDVSLRLRQTFGPAFAIPQ